MPSIPSTGCGRCSFVQAAYRDGQLASSILDCPFGHPGEPCLIARHGRRARKTGPVHPLVVLRCGVHERAFTVYPPGFVPYARRQLVQGPVQHDVPSLVEVVDDAATRGPRGRLADGRPEGSWSTQNRLLDLVSHCFGLAALESRIRVATALAIPLTDLELAARARGIRARGCALQPLVDGLCADELLALGARSGCWGQPHRWCPDRDRLVAMPLSRGPPTTLVRGHPGHAG